MKTSTAARLAPLSDRSPDELRVLLDDAIVAGDHILTLAGDVQDLVSAGASPAEWAALGEDLAEVLPPALKAIEALADAFGLDTAFQQWLARAPQRRAARLARQAARRLDTDGDGVPDRRDRDDDNDGVPDKVDVAPKDPTVATVEDLRQER